VIGEERFEEMELAHEQEVRAELVRALQGLVARGSGEGLSYSMPGVEVRHGDPAAEIHRFADAMHADIVVVGSHGKGALHYAFIGSVAKKVLHHCKKPVLTVGLTDE
jgi:nucleotide-binding universal stress UspA family protein